MLFAHSVAAFFAAFIVSPLDLHAGREIRPGEVTFGIGVSDAEVSTSFDTLFPLAVPTNGLLFINPKISVGDELDPQVSVGLGYRHLFEGPQVIVGANIFYDSFDTVHDHRINQLGIGVEVLSRWVDFRANTATGGSGLQFSNAGGIYNFLGTATLNGGDAGIDILSLTVGFTGAGRGIDFRGSNVQFGNQTFPTGVAPSPSLPAASPSTRRTSRASMPSLRAALYSRA